MRIDCLLLPTIGIFVHKLIRWAVLAVFVLHHFVKEIWIIEVDKIVCFQARGRVHRWGLVVGQVRLWRLDGMLLVDNSIRICGVTCLARADLRAIVASNWLRRHFIDICLARWWFLRQMLMRFLWRSSYLLVLLIGWSIVYDINLVTNYDTCIRVVWLGVVVIVLQGLLRCGSMARSTIRLLGLLMHQFVAFTALSARLRCDSGRAYMLLILEWEGLIALWEWVKLTRTDMLYRVKTRASLLKASSFIARILWILFHHTIERGLIDWFDEFRFNRHLRVGLLIRNIQTIIVQICDIYVV